MALNIIHPYTYRLEGRRVKVDDISLCPERDAKIGDLVSSCLNQKLKVVRYDLMGSDFEKALVDLAIQGVPCLQSLYNPEVLGVITDHYGLPLLGEKPADISDEEWGEFSKRITPDSKLIELISGQDNLFIGGFFEKCVANFLKYCIDFHKDKMGKLFYVPELCVSIDPFLKYCAEEKLERNGINPLTYQEALKFVQEESRNNKQ